MEDRYKSLAAVKSEPWIAHFKKTVGQPSLWTPEPRPVFISPAKKESASDKPNLPLTVVSPVEQYNHMAEAELAKSAKTTQRPAAASVRARPPASAQRKRKQPATSSVTARPTKKIKRLKDLFSNHGKQ